MAELTPEEKDALSHRGRAARALLERIERDGPPPWPTAGAARRLELSRAQRRFTAAASATATRTRK